MRPIRALFALVFAVAALAAAGCGGGGVGSSSASDPGTAALAPENAAIWASVDTDVGSAQWAALDAVLAQIPGAESAIDSAMDQIRSNGKKLDLRKDVLPALGKEVIFVLPFGASEPVLLAKPPSEAPLENLFTGSPPVKTARDGWTVFASTQKALDVYTAAADKGSLSDSDAFKKAMDGLPADALVRAYVDGKGLAGIAGTAAGSASGALKNLPIPGAATLPKTSSNLDSKTLAQLGTIGVALSAGKNEIRVDGSITSSGNAQGVSFKPTLLGQVPADALAALSFAGNASLTTQIRQSLDEAGASAALAQLQKTVGVSLDDLLALAEGEGVVYVRPALIIPEVTVVLAPKDPAKALQTLDTVAGKVTAATGGKATTTTVDGISFTVLRVSILGIGIGRDGDRIVVTTVPTAIKDFDGSGAKLVDSDRFKQAAQDVGFGDATSGFAYVDVKGLAPLLNTIASAAGSGSGSSASVQKVVDALTAIDSLTLNSKTDNGRTSFQGAVRVG